MAVVGALIVAALSYFPYTLTAAKDAVTSVWTRTSAPPEVLSQSPAPPPPPVLNAGAWYEERGEEAARHAALVETAGGERALVEHNADGIFNPASLLKLATTTLALRRFGPDYRFQTRVYAEGTVGADGLLRGRLYFIGGDPTFGDRDANFIAQELRRRGINRVSDGLAVSPDFAFNFSERPEQSAKLLQAALTRDRIQTGSNATVAAEPNGQLLFTFSSYPLRDTLLYMNAHSSNFVADKIGELFGGAPSVQRFLVEELGVPAERVVIVRPSGRGQNRLTARGAVAIVRALYQEAARHGLRLEDLMPVATSDHGTLSDRFKDTPLAGAVIGKTGTMTADIDGGMACLAGIIYTQNSEPLFFALLDQGSRIAENRKLEDQLLVETVAAFGAAPRPINNETPRRQLSSDSFRIE